jgi:hypothetical protein
MFCWMHMMDPVCPGHTGKAWVALYRNGLTSDDHGFYYNAAIFQARMPRCQAQLFPAGGYHFWVLTMPPHL